MENALYKEWYMEGYVMGRIVSGGLIGSQSKQNITPQHTSNKSKALNRT